MSCLKMLPDDFFDLTPRAFQLGIKAYNEQKEAESKLTLEAARLTGFLSARINFSEETQNKIKLPQDYFPFSWDKERPKKELRRPTNENLEKARAWLAEDNSVTN